MSARPELILGTVQLGMPYGIAGPREGVPETEALAILHHARERGVRWLDTAAGYGESERRIGLALGDDPELRVITKLRALDPASGLSPREQVQRSVQESLARLRRTHLEVVMVHRPADLSGEAGAEIWNTLRSLRDAGRIGRIGVSVYNGREIDALLARYPLEVIQLPLSLLDQRLLSSGHLDLLHSRGVAIHLRSIFLQGVLLQEHALPEHLAPLRPVLSKLHRELDSRGLRPLQAALGFARSLPRVEGVVIGVDGIPQLDQVLECWNGEPVPDLDWGAYAVTDEALLDPSRWPPREQLLTAAGG